MRMKKSIAFFISFIVTIIFISLIIVLLKPIKSTALPIILSIGFIFFMLFQGLLKMSWNNKILKKSTVLIKLENVIFTNVQKSWLFLFLIIIYFSPILREQSFQSVSLNRIFYFLVFTIIVFLLLKFSERTMKVIFTKEGIVVTGLDLRVDISLGQPLHNTTGFYPYSMISGYLPLANSIELFLEYEQGKILAIADDDIKIQILGILKANKIEMKKYE